jgi:glutaredoxin-like YruB-family protein
MEVIVYTMPGCSFCGMVKEYLTKVGVEYQEYDVSKDRDRAKEMMMKSRQKAVPVLDINGRIIVGFRPDAIQNALNSPKVDRNTIITNFIFDPFDQ